MGLKLLSVMKYCLLFMFFEVQKVGWVIDENMRLTSCKKHNKFNVKGGNQTSCNVYTQIAGNPAIIIHQY